MKTKYGPPLGFSCKNFIRDTDPITGSVHEWERILSEGTYVPTYEGIYSENTGRKGIGRCFHVKIDVKFKPKASTYTSVPYVHDGTTTMLQVSTYDSIVSPPGFDIPEMPLDESSFDYGFFAEALNKVRPKFAAEMSLPNFLFELKDLGRIIPKPDQLREYADALSKNSGNPFKKRLRSGAHFAASQHLSAQFGYLPLIDDAFTLIDEVKNFDSKKERFVRAANKPHTGYFKQNIALSESPKVLVNDHPLARIFKQRRVTGGYIVAGVKYNFSIDPVSLQYPFLFSKYIGFRHNPRILWDALPFSFVIDWFAGAGSFLEQYDPGALDTTFNVEGGWVTHFTQYEDVYSIQLMDGYAGGSWGGGSGIYAIVRYEVYDRRPAPMHRIDPLGVAPWKYHGLNQNKVMLGISLATVLTHKK